MKMGLASWLGALALLLSGYASGFEAIDYQKYFPQVAQEHGGNNESICKNLDTSSFYQTGEAKINGTAGLALNYCTVNDGSDYRNYGLPDDGCDTTNAGYRKCTISGKGIRGLPVSGLNVFKTVKNKSGYVSCWENKVIPLGDDGNSSFGNVALSSGCSLEFSEKQKTYYLNEVRLDSNSKLVLSAGDYWIKKLTIGSGSIELKGDVRIFIDVDIDEHSKKTVATDISSASINDNGDYSLLLFGYGDITFNNNSEFNGYVYSNGHVAVNENSVINGRVTSRSLFMNTRSEINDRLYFQSGQPETPPETPPEALQCVTESFDQSLSADWVMYGSANSNAPRAVDGRLRLTDAKKSQAVSATYQRIFPSYNNKIVVTFNHYAYGGNASNGVNADGIAVVLSDASVPPQPGSPGGPLGYGFGGDKPGFAGGWLGVGIDEFGNYSAFGGTKNITRRQQSIAVRGSYYNSWTSGYNYIDGTCRDNINKKSEPCLDVSVQRGGVDIINSAGMG